MPKERTIYDSLPSQQSQQSVVGGDARASYVLITPVRDEEGYIGAMIDSIACQTISPKRWIIVDDGSQDRTTEIVTEYARRLPFIELITLPVRAQRLAGGEGAIPFALQHIDLNQFAYLARFDADLVFPPDYIERILEEFQRDPTLGIAGGMLYVQKENKLTLEPNPQFHVRGALKMYCIQCLADIGGLTTDLGWDTIDEVRAWSKGWTTRSFCALHVIHCRPTGDGSNGSRLFWQRGRVDYLIWSHPLYVLTRGVRIAYLDRSLIKPCYYLAGYIVMFLNREPRTKDRDFIRARRAQQISRLAEFFTYFGRSTTH
jgi:glycosyltransferase involved in cell wall biosynthesis